MFPTVNCVPVAISESPSAEETMIEFGANEVALVPPFATERSPEIVERVVVDCHVGTPFPNARTCPSVPVDVVESCPVPFPKRIEFDWMLDQPVPPPET